MSYIVPSTFSWLNGFSFWQLLFFQYIYVLNDNSMCIVHLLCFFVEWDFVNVHSVTMCLWALQQNWHRVFCATVKCDWHHLNCTPKWFITIDLLPLQLRLLQKTRRSENENNFLRVWREKKIYSEILICTCLVLFERIVNNQLCSGTFSTLIADPRRLIGIFIVFERYFEVRIIIVNCLKPLLLLFGTCFISNHSQKWRLFGFVCSSNWMFAIFQVCQLWTWCQSLFLETFFWM